MAAVEIDAICAGILPTPTIDGCGDGGKKGSSTRVSLEVKGRRISLLATLIRPSSIVDAKSLSQT